MPLPDDLYVDPPDFLSNQVLTADDLDELSEAIRERRGAVVDQEAVFHDVTVFAPAFEGDDATGTLIRHQQQTVGAGAELGRITFEAYTEGDSLESASGADYGDRLEIIGRIKDDSDTERMWRIIGHRLGQRQGEMCLSAADDDGAGDTLWPEDPADEHLRIRYDGQVRIRKLQLHEDLEPAEGTSTEVDEDETDLTTYTVTRTGRHIYLVTGTLVNTDEALATYTGKAYYTRGASTTQITAPDALIPTITLYHALKVPVCGIIIHDGEEGDVLKITYESDDPDDVGHALIHIVPLY